MLFEKVDTRFFNFYQGLANVLAKIGIPLKVSTNFFLIVTLLALTVQIYYIHLMGVGIGIMLIKIVPTLLLLIHFRGIRKKMKAGQVIKLDFIRAFSSLFCLIAAGTFLWMVFLSICFGTFHERAVTADFKAEMAYVIAFIALPSFVYLLSCTEQTRIGRNKQLNA